ncbi:phosphoribosylanthranilate isomerase [Marinibactrum halimedae]|uniref:N-(5'-phosphoribosyl)anthranilate isomerase n=1 Tax=Marinibactrum halimedae TaxID=1444977 RepID=A0AA37T4H1_9GAMM|nr:phosphoribosylanthranilate isomerase [Marinibactrum halimedae]MCD9460756.1 phosphoribosylanthranilate isomerase [Marinibactrum halimedae]GLS26670.1 N-(5'-phosphoribosyl)anthranilate isomerase [Marinibactrum halimedae]
MTQPPNPIDAPLNQDTTFPSDHLYQPRVKVCGITRLDDAHAAVQAGVDAIGLVFYEKSTRFVEIQTARDIALAVGPFVSVTALFVDAEPDTIETVLSNVPVHLIQFHGQETNEFCQRFQRPFLKAVRMKPGVDIDALLQSYPDAQGLLLDTYRKGVPGGTGERFDWALFPEKAPRPLVLAGGLTPENVVEAIAMTKPYGVDVSGGVESAPGVKSHQKMIEFATACGRWRRSI